jgi:flagellin
MPVSINTNISSLMAQQYLSQNQRNLSNTIQRMSSGKRIVSASDDPAGLAISSSMSATLNGLNVGSRNGQDGINAINTAQGAMQSILNNLQTMNSLAVQAANGTNSSSDSTNLDTQYQALLGEIDRLSAKVKFNGVALLNGGSIGIQIGDSNTSNDTISVALTNTTSGTAGLSIAGSSLTSTTNASAAIGSLGTAIQTLTTGLATLGAYQSNLQAAIDSNNGYAANLSASQSSIMDADMAAESANMAKFNVLNQADVAMLAQANSVPSFVLKLLS